MKYSIIIAMLYVFTMTGCDSTDTGKSPTKSEPVKVEEVKAESVKVEEVTQEIVASKKVEPETSAVVASVEAEPKADRSGEVVYKKYCLGCHSTGAAGAPKLGDEAAWKARIAKGQDALYASAKNGVPATAMMAKGTCANCNDAELQAAVDYMVSKVK